MRELSHGQAFEAVGRLLSGATEREWKATHPAIDRLRVALEEAPQRPSALDIAVLVRQALQFEFARRDWSSAPQFLITHPRLAGFARWAEVGIQARATQGGVFVTALPWSPNWLDVQDPHGVDARATAEITCRFGNGHGEQGDPFLKAVRRTTYRSLGQRAAVRAALSTPPGATLVVALPTGEGKSLIFQLVHAIGFTGDDVRCDRRGVTLVIVPTVALGVNHEFAAIDECGLEGPLAYQGGSEARNAVISERIAEGTQGLCFASPEAACGSLRKSLLAAAEAGYLKALVIDEAHLVDQWGTGFRTEFQELSGLRRELLATAPVHTKIRTLLLSATLTDSSLGTLETFFGGDGLFESVAAVQLRPEPDYWVAENTSEDIRTERVLEALFHLPRPLVLYVTEVQRAETWWRRLRETGFARIGKLHGGTRREDREKVVDLWRQGQLDIVVGTSAFGLGIDYAHARAVVHACVPETLDRFYQEVGRGGRDGRSSISLIVPTFGDFETARTINAEKVIGIERGRQRWIAMFDGKQALPGGQFAVQIDGRPGVGEADIDMQGERNTDWNVRTLTLMARAGMIKLIGQPVSRPSAVGEWLGIEILDHTHLQEATWRSRVEPVRVATWLANEKNLDLMRRYLRDSECPANILEELYGADRVGRTCSRCRICRKSPQSHRPSIRAGEPRAPWTAASPDPRIDGLLGSDGRLLVTYDRNSFSGRSLRRLNDTFRELRSAGVWKLLILGVPPFDVSTCLTFSEETAFFVSAVESLAWSRLPAGAEVVLVGERAILDPVNLVPRHDGGRIFMCHRDMASPDGSGRRLIDVFGGRIVDLDEFHMRVVA